MFLRLEDIPPILITGIKIKTNLNANFNVAKNLWIRFMSKHKQINNRVGTHYYSIQEFDLESFEEFTPETSYDKWASVQVSDHNELVDQMINHTITGGLYAVFNHKGLPQEIGETVEFIHGVWLPKSNYYADANRPHFQIMKQDYSPIDPEAEEEVWIPILSKN